MVTLQDARDALANEWNQLSPKTPEEIADFYINTPHYKADLDAWHQDPYRQLWSNALCAAAKTIDAKRILDVGAGAGHDIEALNKYDPSMWIEAIEPNKILQQHLLDNVPVHIVHDDWSSVSDNPYDLIYTIDVLEHLPNPSELLENMLPHLKMGGIFIEATATHDVGTPLHLPELRGWSPGRFLDRHGFELRESLGRLRIWQRVKEARGNEPSLLLCVYRDVAVDTSGMMLKLKERDWRVSVFSNDALISRIRSIAISSWYQEDDGDVFLMIDNDITFNTRDAEKIIEDCRQTRSIVSAAYPVRGATHFASRFISNKVKFGPDLKLKRIKWAGTGFIAVHRDVIDALIAKSPLCILNDETWFWPVFQPFIYKNKQRGYNEYLSEDWAFCERARRLGFKTWVDPSIIVVHNGAKEYTVYDMFQETK